MRVVALLVLVGCPSSAPVEVEPDAYRPAPEPEPAECDVIEVRGAVVDCLDEATWCDSSEQGVEDQLACCRCSAASCFVHLSAHCE